MEVTLRTAQEFHDAHVTIEIKAARREVPDMVTRLLADGIPAGGLEEARQEIEDLKATLVREQAERQANKEWAERAETQVSELGVTLKMARDAADIRLKDTEARYQQAIGSLEREQLRKDTKIQELEGVLATQARLLRWRGKQIWKIDGIVSESGIDEALKYNAVPPYVHKVQQAIRGVRKILDEPSPRETSQA